MKKLMFPPPVATKTVYTIWKQIVKLIPPIPPQIVLEAATETKILSRMFDYLKGLCPEFASCKYGGFLSRFKERAIHALDSSTIQLTLNCFDWARHRRQKAAAK